MPCEVVKSTDDLTLINRKMSNKPRDMQTSINRVAQWCKKHATWMQMSAGCSPCISVRRMPRYRVNRPLPYYWWPWHNASHAPSFFRLNINDHLSFEQYVKSIESQVRIKMFVLLKLKHVGISQNLSGKTICPGHDSYEEFLFSINITPLAKNLDKSCAHYDRTFKSLAHYNNKLLQQTPSTLCRSATLKHQKLWDLVQPQLCYWQKVNWWILSSFFCYPGCLFC